MCSAFLQTFSVTHKHTMNNRKEHTEELKRYVEIGQAAFLSDPWKCSETFK